MSAVSRSACLAGQTVVVIGGSAGIGLETARLARAEGADVILTARDAVRLERIGREIGAMSVAAFDAPDFPRLRGFFEAPPGPLVPLRIGSGPGGRGSPLAQRLIAPLTARIPALPPLLRPP